MVQHPANGDRPGAETLDLHEVQRRLRRLIETRLLTGLDSASQIQFEQLIRREKDLLGVDRSAG